MTVERRPKVLFVTYGGGHVAMVLPVAKYLERTGLADPVIVALTLAGKACRQADVPYLGAKDLLPVDGEQRAEVLRLGAELTADFEDHPDIDREESVAYHGLSYFDLVERLGAEVAAQTFAEQGRRAFLPVALFARIIGELAPDVVVATNSPRSEQAALIAASTLGVPSCCILDLFGVRADWLIEPGYATRLCVLSESVRTMLIANGGSADAIIATGNPAFDALAQVRDRRIDAARPNGFNVLWAANPEPERHPFDGRPGNHRLLGQIADEMRRCAELHPDWNIVVRPHPSQHDFEVDGPSNLRTVRGAELEDQLVWSDVVVAVVSTVAMQASLAGIPAISVQGSVVSADWPLAELGFAHSALAHELGAKLEQLQTAPIALDPGLAEVGGAAQRVAEVVMNLAATSQATSAR